MHHDIVTRQCYYWSLLFFIMAWMIFFLFLSRTVFDEGIDDIPSAGAPLDKFLCCDVCMRKDDKRRLAQIYCVICQKKFCTPHEKVSSYICFSLCCPSISILHTVLILINILIIMPWLLHQNHHKLMTKSLTMRYRFQR